MTKNGQATLEFLTMYGWAILVVIVFIGVMAYYGVLSPESAKYIQKVIVVENPLNVTCETWTTDMCGLQLTNCYDNKTYGCVTNVKYTLQEKHKTMTDLEKECLSWCNEIEIQDTFRLNVNACEVYCPKQEGNQCLEATCIQKTSVTRMKIIQND